ncbi:MAG TPA: S8 family serine peptidase [Candidatus Limnocylindrales bacterium]
MQHLRRSGSSVALAVALLAGFAAPAAPVASAAARDRTSAGEPTSVAAAPAATSSRPARPTVPGVVLVGWRAGTSSTERAAKRRFVHATSSERLSPLAGTAERLTLAPGASVDAAVSALSRDPDVRFAEPDYVLRTADTSDDTYLLSGQLWGMLATSASPNDGHSGAVSAWAQGVTGSRNMVVGVVDEGIQVDHPDLAANIWTNPWDPVDGIDNDGNGYVDDVHGWDFLNDDNTVYDGPDAGNPDLDAHGTHVAGTIGGVGGNGTGVAGVSWSVTMISAKFLQETGDVSDAVRALDYLTDLKVRHGLDIVASNDSWGGGEFSQALLDAINRGGDHDILFVAAAGNSGADNDGPMPFSPGAWSCDRHYPSGTPRGYDCIVAVAAIDETGHLASFSNFGSTTVDLGAPGVGIISTFPGNGYAIADGTSMAAPHVSGALALLASCDYGRSAAQLRADLVAAGTATTGLGGGRTVTGKRLNVGALIAAHCGASVAPSAVITSPSGVGVQTSLTETVAFSHAVTGLAAGDFTVGGTSAGWSVSGVSGSGAGPYDVTLTSAAPTEGTLLLTLTPNAVTDGTTAGPSAAVSGPSVHIDRTGPTATLVAPHSPTKASTLTETLAFDEPVTGLVAGDLSVHGTATGCVVGAPAALDARTFGVQVSGCSEGTMGLTLASKSVVDLSGNLGPAAAASSTLVAIDRTPATATLVGPASPTHAAAPVWTLTFSEPVTGLSAGDLTRGGTATGCVVGTPVKTGTTTYTAAVSSCGNGTLSLALKAGSALDLAGNLSPAGAVGAAAVTVDHSLPTTTAPVVVPNVRAAVSGSTMPIRVTWTGSDSGTGIVRYEIQRSINGHAFTSYSTTLTSPSTTMGVSSGMTMRLQVRAVDAAGNVGKWMAGPTFSASLVQQTSSSIRYAGSWRTYASSLFSGGSVRAASRTSASATFSFTGRTIGLVSTLATTRGTARIYLDGADVTRVDMLHSPTMYRGVAWQRTWSSSGRHTIKVVIDGKAGRPRVDLDAFIVLR